MICPYCGQEIPITEKWRGIEDRRYHYKIDCPYCAVSTVTTDKDHDHSILIFQNNPNYKIHIIGVWHIDRGFCGMNCFEWAGTLERSKKINYSPLTKIYRTRFHQLREAGKICLSCISIRQDYLDGTKCGPERKELRESA